MAAEKRNEVMFSLDDEKINVAVMGVSGSGKSTLINAILEEDRAPVGTGDPVTQVLEVYEKESLPFRMIDTVGYEYGMLDPVKVRAQMQKWSKDAVKKKDTARIIHIIWFCVDAQSKRIFRKTLDNLREVSRLWNDVPILVVFTKSYAETEDAENRQMFLDVLSRYKKKEELNIRGIVPVVAKELRVTETVTVAPRGLDTLVSWTNSLIPEAKRLSRNALRSMDLQMKRAMANSLIAGSVAGAAVVGAVPIPVADSAILVPLQYGMLTRIGKIYGMEKDSAENSIIENILKVGATTMAGRSILSAVKAIPGLHIAASVLNALVAGTVTFAAGEISVLVFEGIRKGDIDPKAVDWARYIDFLFREKLPKYTKALEEALEKGSSEDVLKNLMEILKGKEN
ncbi:MAG: GTP-binding DUF697 domain-containing protein [Clostridium sp.]|nr:GTP-binding DUF697 domain-containing protein [Clostridium sp.]